MTPVDSDINIDDLDNPNTIYEKDRKVFDRDSKSEVKDEAEEITWQKLAALQDRLCFYVYLVTCLTLIVVFVLALLGVM